MAINFPDSPSNGDTHTASGRTFTYNTSKTKWVYSNSPNASVTSSDTAPSNPNVGDMWLDSTTGELLIYYADGSSNQWIGVSGTAGPQGAAGSAGSSVTSYAAPSNFPSSGNSVGDFAFATSAPKALYVWDGAEWDRIYSGQQEDVSFTTDPPASIDLAVDGSTSTITAAATDPDGFPISYSYDTNPSSPDQVTSIVNNNNGSFTLTPSTNAAHAGSFIFRTKAADGVMTSSRSTSVALLFAYSIEYLLVGGGGSGGTGSNTAGSGGGGAGGFLTSTTAINEGTVYQIVIGEGGVDSGSGGGDDGSPTTAFGITAGGGGHGGTAANSAGNDGSNGSNNSSGGGSSAYSSTGGSGNGTGNSGGNSSSSDYNGSGGGGSGSVGVNANGITAGDGGSGSASSITGASVTYAAGGGGGNRNIPSGTGAGQGGHSSAGDGSSWAANGSAGGRGTNATANSGSGGGGSVGSFSFLGGNGASGIVVIKVLTSDYSGTTTGSPTITTSGSHTIIKFTASGSYTA